MGELARSGEGAWTLPHMGCGTKPGSGLTMVDRIRLIEEQLQWRWAGWHWRCAGISDERHQTTSWTTGRSDEARPAGQAWQAGGHQASYCQVPLLEQGCKPRGRRIARFQAEPGRETSSPACLGCWGHRPLQQSPGQVALPMSITNRSLAGLVWLDQPTAPF